MVLSKKHDGFRKETKEAKEIKETKEAKDTKETVIVCSAHSDDFVIGAGGTIAKYTKEGKKVIAVIFSYGEKSHPWLKKEVVQKMRADETLEASKLLQCKTVFFDLRELAFLEDATEKKVYERFLALLEKEKPTKVFTHSNDDPHPDHQAVHTMTLRVIELMEQKKRSVQKPELYIYSVWNPVSFRTIYPSLVVDIRKTFSVKLKALKTFRSQKVHVAYPFVLLLFRAIHDGFKIRKLFGEKFFRIQ